MLLLIYTTFISPREKLKCVDWFGLNMVKYHQNSINLARPVQPLYFKGLALTVTHELNSVEILFVLCTCQRTDQVLLSNR